MRSMTQSVTDPEESTTSPTGDTSDAVHAAVLHEVSRRNVLRWTAIAGGAASVAGAGSWGLLSDSPAAVASGPSVGLEKMVWSACNVNCGSRCPVRLAVVDGTIVRVDPDNTGDDSLGTQTISACVRGRSIRQRIYSAERLKKPMKRVGPRGAGEWEEISWDTAFTTIADNLKRLIKQHGNESIYINYGTGVIGATLATSWPPGSTAVARLMNCIGGSLNQYNDYSAANIV